MCCNVQDGLTSSPAKNQQRVSYQGLQLQVQVGFALVILHHWRG